MHNKYLNGEQLVTAKLKPCNKYYGTMTKQASYELPAANSQQPTANQ